MFKYLHYFLPFWIHAMSSSAAFYATLRRPATALSESGTQLVGDMTYQATLRTVYWSGLDSLESPSHIYHILYYSVSFNNTSVKCILLLFLRTADCSIT